MQIGTCPACTRAYSASEVAGFGILRPRPARRGGPLVEFACPGCGRVIRLVPHGEGRYAPPGQPPPPAVPAALRRPPWLADAPAEAAVGVPPTGASPEPGPAPDAEPEPIEVEPPEPPAPAAEGPAEGPMTPTRARAILELGPTASGADIDRAFRERSRTCHPDKVAHLDADFQALAERKFRLLKAAHDLLRS